MRFTTARRMSRVDRITIEDHRISETALMETAGQLTARHARRHFLKGNSSRRVTVLCGKGHNGADGLVTARWLQQWDFQVRVLMASPEEECSELTRKQAVSLRRNPRVELTTHPDEDPRAQPDLCIDALLGTGLSGDPRPPYDELIRRLNERSVPVVSIDVPSGLSGNRHVPYSPCVDADLTVTFGLPKLGTLLEPGYTRVGEMIVQELGFPEPAYEEAAGPFHLIVNEDVRSFLPGRRPTGHKGVSGRLAVVAGSESYPGAAFLTGNAASEAGAGLVSIVGPEGIHAQQTATERDLTFPHSQQELPEEEEPSGEVADFLEAQNAYVLGPGLGVSDDVRGMLDWLLPRLSGPAIVDADGLNNFAGEPEALSTCETAVLTPHPGEAARLLSAKVEDVLKDPIDSSKRLADTTGHTVVLKTSRPLVVHPDGSVSVNVTGPPALAKAGSGDVLSGLIGSWLAQGLPPGPAACLGLYLHGAAARRVIDSKDELTLRAEDLIRHLSPAIQQLDEKPRPDWFPVQFESHALRTLRWTPFPG